MEHLPNILIVDDTPENLTYLEAVIRKIQVNLIQALSGSSALEKTRGVELALAIIDVRMPGMNGYELAMKMNEERTGDKVPVIFLTANYFSEMEMFKGYDSGAVDYIFKPIDNHILLSKINVFLELYDQKQKIIRDSALLKESADELAKVNAALKKSEEKYRSYIDNAPDGVFVADETGRYLEVNEAACRITGYSKEELFDMSFSDILTEESLNEGRAQFRKAVETGAAKADLQFKHKSGIKRWWVVECVKLAETRFLCFTKDITERKQAEKARQEALWRMESIIEGTHAGTWEWNVQTGETVYNKVWAEIIGYSLEELAPLSITRWESFIFPDDLKQSNELLERHFAGELPYYDYEYRMKHKSGKWVWIHDRGRLISRTKDGKPLMMFGIHTDITERKQTEEIIRKRIVALTQPLEGGTITFEELFNINEIQIIQDEFAMAMGVASIITKVDGTPITSPSNFTNLCGGIIRKTKKGCSNCFKSDATLGRYHPDGPIIQPCLSGGLWDAGVSITVGGHHIANWLIGQVRNETQSEEKMRDYASKIGADETSFIQAFCEVPSMSYIQFQQIARVLFTLANQLSSTAYQNIQQARYITERKQSEVELRESQTRIMALLSAIPDIMFMFNNKGVFLDFHAADSKQLLVGPELFIGRNIVDIMPKDVAELTMIHLKEIFETGKTSVFEYNLQLGSETQVYESRIVACGKDTALGIVRDITERKKAEDALRESELLLRKSQTVAHLGSFTWNISSGIWKSSKILDEILGIDHDYFRSLDGWANIIIPEQREIMIDYILNEVIAKHQKFDKEYRIIRKNDGKERWVHGIAEIEIDSNNQPIKLTGTITDITDRKQAEEKLRKLSTAVEQSSASIVITDIKGDIEYINPKFTETSGYSYQEVIGLNPRILKSGVTTDEEYLTLWKTISSGGVWNGDFCNKKKIGTLFWESVSISPIINESGVITHYVAVKEDITERKHIQESLRKSEAKFKALYENAPMPYQSIDENAIIIDVNPAWLKTLGYQRDEVIGKSFTDFIAQGLEEIYFNEFSKMKTDGFVHNFEFDLKCKSGKTINALFDGIVNYTSEGKFDRTYTTFKDVTQEKQLDKLITTAIIESEEKQRGIFAQELHDGLGPMLASIKLFLKSMENKKEKENIEPIIGKVNEILNESIVILKELSNNLSPHILVNHGLDSALNDFIRKIKVKGTDIKYESTLTGRLSNIIETGLYRVITEMINNTIKHADATQVKISISRMENSLNLIYSDNGCGFDVTLMLQTNKGNGLYNIINRMKAMDATYRFSSKLGDGFSFDANIKI